jgi:predicted amidohydrolase
MKEAAGLVATEERRAVRTVDPINERQIAVGLAQWLPQSSDPDAALDQALGFVQALAVRGCDLVVLPELWPCAHDPADPSSVLEEAQRHAEPLDGPRNRALAAIASEHQLWLAAGSVPETSADGIFNSAPLFSPDGSLRAVHRKAHLYRAGHEDLAFRAGDCLTACDTELLGRVGLTICFDGDFPEVARSLRRCGARVVIQVNAYEQAAADWWDRIYRAHALINGQWWIMANQCGTQGSTTFIGRSQIISPVGDVVAQASRANPGQTPEPALLVHTLELNRLIRRADEEVGVLVDDVRSDLHVEIHGDASSGVTGTAEAAQAPPVSEHPISTSG